jgi:hypothetical protein
MDFYFSETVFCYVAQAGLEHSMVIPVGLQLYLLPHSLDSGVNMDF